jgi:hypothetical protein
MRRPGAVGGRCDTESMELVKSWVDESNTGKLGVLEMSRRVRVSSFWLKSMHSHVQSSTQ